jgi:hypothetical protein
MLALQASHPLSNHAPKRSCERRGPTLDQCDWQAQLTANGGNLRSGEPTPDDEYPFKVIAQALLEELRVIASPQGEDAIKRCLGWIGPGPRSRPGGNKEAVERDVLSIGQTDLLALKIQTCCCNPQPPFNIIQSLKSRQLGMFSRNPTGQDGFRERRAIIGQIRFISNKRQVPSKPFGTQGFRSTKTSKGSAYNHDASAVFESGPDFMAPHMAPRLICG